MIPEEIKQDIEKGLGRYKLAIKYELRENQARRYINEYKKEFGQIKSKEPDKIIIDPALIKENELLKKQLDSFARLKHTPVSKFYSNSFKFGVVSDTQYGSLYCNYGAIESAYNCFEKEGITQVYHSGDIVEGINMYRGQIYEMRLHGYKSQTQEVIDKYPKKEGITTDFITGNHDLSFWKTAEVDIGERIANHRSDMIYRGQEEADIILDCDGKKVILRLVHPGKGTAYALSYHPQKYIESLSGGEKPHIVLMGHYHKAEFIPMYRNVMLIQTGTCQSQTGFMRRNNIPAHVGFWIIEGTVNENAKVSRFKAEWFAIYEG